jgi:hypothetical protein
MYHMHKSYSTCCFNDLNFAMRIVANLSRDEEHFTSKEMGIEHAKVAGLVYTDSTPILLTRIWVESVPGYGVLFFHNLKKSH